MQTAESPVTFIEFYGTHLAIATLVLGKFRAQVREMSSIENEGDRTFDWHLDWLVETNITKELNRDGEPKGLAQDESQYIYHRNIPN